MDANYNLINGIAVAWVWRCQQGSSGEVVRRGMVRSWEELFFCSTGKRLSVIVLCEHQREDETLNIAGKGYVKI